MGPTVLFPLRRKACWGFFCPKNPTVSAGCEPTNLGTKGQHATSKIPKPLAIRLNVEVMFDDFGVYQMLAEYNTIFRKVHKALLVMPMELEEWTFMQHQIIFIISALNLLYCHFVFAFS
jgi:hypothetical protein